METVQYFKKRFFKTILRISRPNQKHMKHVEFLKKCQNHWILLCMYPSPSVHCKKDYQFSRPQPGRHANLTLNAGNN
jgi:hypothetical protein